MMFFYIVANSLQSFFPHVHNFAFFLSDGVLLSQLTSLYLYNEFSMSAILTILPVLFVIHNHLLVEGIQKFVKHEKAGKMSFVRLIGRHDAVFLFVIYSIFTAIFTLVDVCAAEWTYAVNFWYLLYALYAFARLMDHKQSQGKWLYRLSFFSVVLFIMIYGWSISKSEHKPFPDRKFPLNRVENVTENLNATENSNVTLSLNDTVLSNEAL